MALLAHNAGEGLQLSDFHEECLEAQGASTEALRWWRSCEDKALLRCVEGEGLQLGRLERLAVFDCVSSCAAVIGMTLQQRMQAMTILDAFLAKALSEVEIGLMPAAVLAVTLLIKKQDMACEALPAEWPLAVAAFTTQLIKMGYEVPQCSRAFVVAAERVVLSTLEWKVELPSVVSWFEKYSVRFRLVTGAAVEHHVRQFGFSGAAQLVRLKAASAELPPRLAAAGLLALGLVRIAVLPPCSLRPQGTSSDEWLELLCAIGVVHPAAAVAGSKDGPGPTAKCPQTARQFLDMMLLPVVDAGIEELQDACLRVASMLAPR